MSRTAKRALPLLAGAALALLVALPAAAYTIFLKDGTRLTAKEKPAVQGDKLIFTTNIGVVQSVLVSDVDFKKTDAANKSNTGDAYVLEEHQANGEARSEEHTSEL